MAGVDYVGRTIGVATVLERKPSSRKHGKMRASYRCRCGHCGEEFECFDFDIYNGVAGRHGCGRHGIALNNRPGYTPRAVVPFARNAGDR